jgi:predicted nucleic acid-binding protein
MSEVVVDASLIIKVVLKMQRLRAHAVQLVADCGTAESFLVAPPIFPCEVDSIVRRRAHDGLLSARQASDAYIRLDAVPIRIEAPDRLRQRACEIAEKYGQSRFYDASYAALAELHDCEFWTADRAFHEAVKDDLTYVRFLGDYPLP